MTTSLDLSAILAGADPPVDWLIEGLLPRHMLLALAGQPGTGKSVLSYAAFLALGTGLPFLGCPVTAPVHVCYFDQENSYPDATSYLRATWKGLGNPDPTRVHQYCHFYHFQLGEVDWAAKLAACLDLWHPAAFFIDTATPACAIKKEEDNAEAAATISTIRRLQALHRSAAIVLKHAKVDHNSGRYTIRGAKTWEAAVDCILYHVANPGKPRHDGLRVTHLRVGKVRAIGLRHDLHITPVRLPDGGLRLTAAP